MKKLLFVIVLSCTFIFQSCGQKEAASVKVITPQEVYNAVYMPNSDAQLLDVRTVKEYEVNHLKNAQNICVTTSDFSEKVKTLDKNKPVYVYCKSGGRSAKAAKILADMGFKEIYDMQGGITNWEGNELEVEN